MKNKKTVLAAALAAALALSVVTVSAAAISANETKPAAKPDVSVCEASGEQPLKGFVEGLSSLTPEERAALLADLAEIGSLEARIDGLYDSITDENADRIYDEIDALHDKLDSVLDRNAELWDRVDAEYDERIAANEPDMTFELNEADLAVCENVR